MKVAWDLPQSCFTMDTHRKKSSRALMLCALGVFLAQPVCMATQLTRGLYDTGVNDGGVVMPIGSVDPHYVVYGAAEVAYVCPIVYHPDGSQAWVTPPAGSAWIGPDPTGSTYPIDPPGDYFYFIKFSVNLTGFPDPSSVSVLGSWAADIGSHILLNGQETGYSKGSFGFTQLDPFALTGLRAGLNDIEFLVNNEYGPSGLLVSGLTLSVQNADPVPESFTRVEGLLIIVIPLLLVVVLRQKVRA